MQPLDIRISRTLAILLIVVGALLGLTSLLTQNWLSTGAGVILLVLGVLQLVNPTIRIEPGEVQVRNPLGMTLKRFPVSSPADLRLDDKVLTHVPRGKKIASLGFGFEKSDVEALRAQLARGPVQPGQAPQPGQGPHQGGQQWAQQPGQAPQQGGQPSPPPPPQG